MKNAALVLAAHGSNHDPAINARVVHFAEILAEDGDFPETKAAFHQGEPGFSAVLDQLKSQLVVVVPVMTSEGYYSLQVLPSALRSNSTYADKRVLITRPVGAHDMMEKLVVGRALRLAETQGMAPELTTVVLVGHGTPKHPHSRRATEDLSRRIADTGQFAGVQVAFLDDDPPLEGVLERTMGRDVVVEPFLINDGRHATCDLPQRMGIDLGAGARPPCSVRADGRTIAFDTPLGAEPGLVDVIRALAHEAIRAEPEPAR